MLVAVPAQAQIPTAAVSITCQPAEIKVDVKPGSTLVGFTTCTATNPTAYIEKIALSVTSDGLAAAVCHFYNKGSLIKEKGYNNWSSFISKNPNRVKS